MWQRFSFRDVRIIGHYLGVLIIFLGVMMLLPFVTGLVCHEWEPAARYLSFSGLTISLGALLRLCRIEPGRLDRQQAFAVTGLAWIVLAFVASAPLYFSGHYGTYLDALFEGVSGLTTTGATLTLDIDHMSNADNMFRFAMHFVGGLGLIVVAMSLGLFGKRSGASLYNSEARSEHVVPNVIQTTQFISRITLLVIAVTTCLLTVLCLVIGMEPLRAFFHSLWLATSGFVTGGFVPTSQSMMYYHSFALEFILIVVMILGVVNFTIHSEIWRGRIGSFFKDIETRTMVIWVGFMTVVFAASMSASATFSDLPAMLRRGVFMIVSAFTTTGFQNITQNQLISVISSGAFLTLALITAVGACSGGTAGGMKLRRVGIIFKSLVSTVKETLAPDSARVVVSYNHVGRRLLSNEEVKEAMTVFTLFVITYVIGALVGIAHGYGATEAIFESVAMASNGGVTTGIATSGMPASLELFYIFEMWAGRLEFLTLLALLVEIVVSLKPRSWKLKRRKS